MGRGEDDDVARFLHIADKSPLTERAAAVSGHVKPNSKTPSSKMFYVFSFTHLNILFLFVCVSTFSFWSPSTKPSSTDFMAPGLILTWVIAYSCSTLKTRENPHIFTFVFVFPSHSVLCAFHSLKQKQYTSSFLFTLGLCILLLSPLRLPSLYFYLFSISS